MNLTILTGRTTKDIELRYSQDMAIGKFSLAVDDGYGDKQKTYFFNMTAFGKRAEIMEKYVKKGTKILVKCKAVQNVYTDKNGNNINRIDFIVNDFEFIESKKAENENNSQPKSSDGFYNVPDGLDEELPF